VNAYWTSDIPGTARIVTAPFANQARHQLAQAETVVFPNITLAVMGLEQCVENYVHEYMDSNIGHVLQL
jgi:hypothetical protein